MFARNNSLSISLDVKWDPADLLSAMSAPALSEFHSKVKSHPCMQ